MSTSDEKVWQTTAIQNLVRYRPSGTYFARFRVGGKLVWKSLKTATFSVAKQRLPDTLREHRSKIESFAAFADGKMPCQTPQTCTYIRCGQVYRFSPDQKITAR